MEKIGRNEPCSCGSGKKYKQCCLNNATAIAEGMDPVWVQLRTAIEPLIIDLLKFSKIYLPDSAIEEAWEAFTQGEGGSFSSDTPHMPVFMSWFYYNWYSQKRQDSLLDDHSPQILAQAYLKKKRRALHPLAWRYIEQCLVSPLSFFDIVSVKPGQGMLMRDIFTGELTEVIERSGSNYLHPDDIIFAKIVRIDHIHIIEAFAPVAFPPGEKAPILALRQFMQKNQLASLKNEHLKCYEREMLDVYYMIAERLLNPVMPKLKNTDGEDILFHTITHNIDSPQEAFDALKHLCISENEKELLENALFDETGKLSEIEFPWQKKGNKKNKSWSNTILGHIKITPDQLTVEVNSEQRGKKWQSLIKELLAGKACYRTTVITSPDASLEKIRENSTTEEAQKQKQEIDDFNALPEVRAQLNEHLREHYRAWLKQKIPALDNKTPLQAVKTKDGQEMVEALLADTERRMKTMQPPPDLAIFDELRTSLGLEKNISTWLDAPKSMH